MKAAKREFREFRTFRGKKGDWAGPMENDPLASGREIRVLVVDDLPTNQKILRHIIEKFGAAVDTCESGEEAVRLCAENDYELVLMDLHMPSMSGFEAGERILRDRKGDLPLVFAQTADETARACDRTREIGFDGHLTKPIRPQAIRRILDWLPNVAAS